MESGKKLSRRGTSRRSVEFVSFSLCLSVAVTFSFSKEGIMGAVTSIPPALKKGRKAEGGRHSRGEKQRFSSVETRNASTHIASGDSRIFHDRPNELLLHRFLLGKKSMTAIVSRDPEPRWIIRQFAVSLKAVICNVYSDRPGHVFQSMNFPQRVLCV